MESKKGSNPKQKENNPSESIPQEEVIKRLGRANADKVWMVTKLVLAFADKYGDEAFDIVKKVAYERGIHKAEDTKKLMEKVGANFDDPREKRRYGREAIGFWGYVKHTDDKVETKPDGKVRVEYRITKCPWVDTWNAMGLPKDLQLKLDLCMPTQTDIAHNKYFNVHYECDQGMPQGRDCCKFVLEKL